MKLTKEQLTVRAVKNRLCRIEDVISRIFVELPKGENKDKLMMAGIDIDGCVEPLEKLLPNQSTLTKGN